MKWPVWAFVGFTVLGLAYIAIRFLDDPGLLPMAVAGIAIVRVVILLRRRWGLD